MKLIFFLDTEPKYGNIECLIPSSHFLVFIYLFIYLFYFERMNTYGSTAILPCDPHITNEPPHYKTNLRMQKQRR